MPASVPASPSAPPSTALVTGTSSGIGFATALALARAGHRVVAGMRDPGRDGPALREAAGAAGGVVDVVRLDVDDDNSVTEAVAAAGPVDVLVNNAGVSPVGSVEEFPLDAWQQVMQTNVLGVVRGVRAVLPGMRARGRGCIVNVSSVAGRVALPMFGPYSASKFAVEALSESLAIEARPFGVRVVIVEPGAVRTPIQTKTGAPPRESPYRPTARNWGFAVGWDHARATEAEVVAGAIAAAVADPATPLRVTVGQGVDRFIALRERHDDAGWVDLWSSPTDAFVERYRHLTGIDLAR